MQAERIAPVLRPLTQDDFFSWVALLAESLEVNGMSYRDEIALRIWQQLGFGTQPNQRSQLEAVVADRSGNLIGLALLLPSLSLTTGAVTLDVQLAYVHRAHRDEAAARALIDEIQRRAHELGVTEVRWLAADETLLRIAGAGRAAELTVYENQLD
ncbi:hypothetical protein [uncultured Gulosibacter sp.]|uniref:hypothetical protein n=1 Tax=uncultured Gulosibacter sp. TaxID=1339167 RepID=UPI00288A748B|nr:hypothetical protein [uncultured Gulosibacter sp.]